MSGLWFLKWPAIIVLLGFLIRLIGVLFKIRHWPMADEYITVGTMVAGSGIIFAIVKIVFLKKPRQ